MLVINTALIRSLGKSVGNRGVGVSVSHMVIYRGVDGKPGYHQTDDIHDAVTFVEQMRNDEGVEHARIFRLEEVVFEYRPYYRVELTESAAELPVGSNGMAAIDASSTDNSAGTSSSEAGTVLDNNSTVDEPFEVIENGAEAAPRRGLFGR